jgi:hypothetical protein
VSDILYFIPYEFCVGQKVYSMTEESFNIDDSIKEVLDKYNYLYQLSRVPISIENNIVGKI